MFGDRHRGDDRAADRVREVGVRVPGDLAALFAAVEQQQLRGDADRLLFGERHLGGRLTFTDQRRLAGLEGRGGVGRLELTRFTGRDALDVDFGVFVAFDDDFAGRRRMAAVGLLDFAGRFEFDRRLFGLRQRGRGEAAVRRQFEFADFDRDRGFAAAAVAIPTAETAMSAPKARTISTCLRISLYLSFCGQPIGGLTVESLRQTMERFDRGQPIPPAPSL